MEFIHEAGKDKIPKCPRCLFQFPGDPLTPRRALPAHRECFLLIRSMIIAQLQGPDSSLSQQLGSLQRHHTHREAPRSETSLSPHLLTGTSEDFSFSFFLSFFFFFLFVLLDSEGLNINRKEYAATPRVLIENFALPTPFTVDLTDFSPPSQ